MRSGKGGPPLGSEWPGLSDTTTQRTLDALRIRQGVQLGATGLAWLARSGKIISDDNQLLAYGRTGRLRMSYPSQQAMIARSRELIQTAAAYEKQQPRKF